MALAGTFVIQTGKADTALLWFSPQHQLLAFKDPSAFVMHLTDNGQDAGSCVPH